MLFPIRCIRCGRFDVYLCRTCEPFLFAPGNIAQSHSSIHDIIWTGSYKNPLLQRLIHDGKYNGIVAAFEPACRILVSLLSPACFDLILPVPLHPRRLRERGFNQAEIIAHFLSKTLNIPFAKEYLIRTRYTPSQVTLSHEQRQKNLTSAFRVIKVIPSSVHSILLIDDVWTTGATMNAAAQALQKARQYTLAAAVIAKD